MGALGWAVAAALVAVPVGAPAASPPGSRTILVLCGGMYASDLTNPRYPALREAVRSGQIGLMTTAVRGERAPVSAVVTLAAGALAPSEPGDDQARLARSERVEGDPAGAVYARRMGAAPSSPGDPGRETLVHLRWASVLRRRLERQLVGPALARAGRPMSAAGMAGADGRAASLFAVDERGAGSAGPLRETDPVRLAAWAAAEPESVVIQLADRALAQLDALLSGLLAHRGDTARILIVSPWPRPEPDGSWRRLAPVALLEPGAPPGLLTSPTTRSGGIVSNTDIAPSLLHWAGAPVPAAMSGRPLSGLPNPDGGGAVARIDRILHLSAQAMVPTFATIGTLVALLGIGAFLSLWRQPGAARRFAFPVLVALNMPAALLLVAGLLRLGLPVAAPVTYVALTLTAMAICAALSAGLGVALARGNSVRAGHVALAGTLALMWGLILVDAVAGQPMLRFGLLPSYLLGGVRYYGVGNEYMAVLIGTLLCCTFLVRPPRWLAAVVFVAAAAVLGHPRLGANAGGLVAASVAFGTAYTTLRGRRATWSGFVLWSALGFACALGLAWLDAAALGGAPSHIGSALRAAHSEGAGALWEIIARKADMNARTAAIPGNVLAVAVCGLVAWLLWRGPFRARTEALAAREPWVAAAVRPVAFGSLAALLYNDTGIDAAILISGLYLVSIVFLLLAQSALPIRTLARPGDGGTGRRPATGSTGATGTPPPEGQTSC